MTLGFTAQLHDAHSFHDVNLALCIELPLLGLSLIHAIFVFLTASVQHSAWTLRPAARIRSQRGECAQDRENSAAAPLASRESEPDGSNSKLFPCAASAMSTPQSS